MENNNMTLHYFLPKITSSGVVSGLWFFLAFQGNVICQCHRSSNGVVYHFSVTCIYWIQPKMLHGRTRKNKKVKWICCNNFWRCVSSYLVLSHLRFTSSHHNSPCIQNLHFSAKNRQFRFLISTTILGANYVSHLTSSQKLVLIQWNERQGLGLTDVHEKYNGISTNNKQQNVLNGFYFVILFHFGGMIS